MSHEETVRANAWATIIKQVSMWSELVKLRLNVMVLITTAMGFYLASTAGIEWISLLHALLGTGLVAGGAAALNHYLEKDFDARMERTASRPIPAGKVAPEVVLLAGGTLTAIGLVYLALQTNLITSVIGAVTLITYVAVYTPLKRVTSLNTLLGSIPGALPPLMGWTAAGGHHASIPPEAWSLVAILFFWQLPHFLSLLWIHREEYEKAGFEMISKGDKAGKNTGRSAFLYCLALVPASLSPCFMEISGAIYGGGAILLSGLFLASSWTFFVEMTLESARRLFYSSLLYLPFLLGLMIADRLVG